MAGRRLQHRSEHSRLYWWNSEVAMSSNNALPPEASSSGHTCSSPVKKPEPTAAESINTTVSLQTSPIKRAESPSLQQQPIVAMGDDKARSPQTHFKKRLRSLSRRQSEPIVTMSSVTALPPAPSSTKRSRSPCLQKSEPEAKKAKSTRAQEPLPPDSAFVAPGAINGDSAPNEVYDQILEHVSSSNIVNISTVRRTVPQQPCLLHLPTTSSPNVS
jgi:hypothetical protein